MLYLVEVRSIVKGNVFTPPSPLNKSSYFLSVKSEMVDILNICSKNVHKEFFSHKSTPPSAQAKWEDNMIQAFWVNGKK